MLRYPILFKFFLGFIVKLLFVSFFPECDDSFLKFVFSRWANVSRPRYLWRQQLIQRIATTNCVSFWKAWTLSILAILIPVYFLTSWLNRGKTTGIGDWRDRWAHSAVHQIGGEATTWPVITGTKPTHSWLSASRVMFLFLVQFFLPFALNFIICLFRLNRVSQACPPPRSVPRKCPLTRPHGEKERETHSENPPVSSIIYLFQLYCKFEN